MALSMIRPTKHPKTGIWYAAEVAKWADDAGSVEQWDAREFVLLVQLETRGDPDDQETWTQVLVVSEQDRVDVAELLAAHGMPPTQEAARPLRSGPP